jgi:hypothetical protein
VGTWSGYLFGLVQDFAKGDDAVDGLALAYADEQRVTNSTGHVTQLILQVKVSAAVLSRCQLSDVQLPITHEAPPTYHTLYIYAICWQQCALHDAPHEFYVAAYAAGVLCPKLLCSHGRHEEGECKVCV